MRPLNILSAHNFYRESGGEDRVFAAEAALLEAKGHRVERYWDSNDRIAGSGLAVAGGAVWNSGSYRKVQRRVRGGDGVGPVDLAHFHNTFPLISPSAYYASQRAGVPVVQTLHNYRLICPGATLSREGRACEECLDQGSLLPAIRNRCYRGSLGATVALSAMLTVHRAAGTYAREVDAYIALSEFARRKFVESGLPEERVFVKGNYVRGDDVDVVCTGDVDRGRSPTLTHGAGGDALFVGRLSEEKGVRTLGEAFARLPGVGLKVVGDGPLRDTRWPAGGEWIGAQSREQVLGLMRQATVLVVPSTCYENCPMVILEAMACGLPVIASKLGSMPELVKHGYNGLLFRAGDAEDLAAQVRWALTHPQEMAAMRQNCYAEYRDRYTPDRNYDQMMTIYGHAMERAAERRRDRRAS